MVESESNNSAAEENQGGVVLELRTNNVTWRVKFPVARAAEWQSKLEKTREIHHRRGQAVQRGSWSLRRASSIADLMFNKNQR